MNKIAYKNKGFTLIEVIIAIAILGIISIAFLPMFTGGIIGIVDAGSKSREHYAAQEKIEINIDNSTEELEGVESSTCDSIVLTFNGEAKPVNGRKINVQYNYGKTQKILTTFITQ